MKKEEPTDEDLEEPCLEIDEECNSSTEENESTTSITTRSRTRHSYAKISEKRELRKKLRSLDVQQTHKQPRRRPVVQALFTEPGLMSAAEGLSSLDVLSPPHTPSKTAAKRKRAPRDLGTPKAATERPATRRKARRGEPCIVVVKGRQLNIDDAMGPSSSSGGGGGGAPSLYSLARLWIDNNTHTIHRPYLAREHDDQLDLPPPAPHTLHSAARSPSRKPKQTTQSFDEQISAQNNQGHQVDVSSLKDGYVAYAKSLRTWLQSQYMHRLHRCRHRLKLLSAHMQQPQPQ